MKDIPLFIFYINSFLISIFIVKTRFLEHAFSVLFFKKNISIHKLLLFFMLFLALVSSFLPNTYVGLIFVNMICGISGRIQIAGKTKSYIPTLFGLSLLYSCNAGGIMSLTGNAGNGLLLGITSIYKIPHPTYYSFFGWLLWGIPLCFLLVFVSWGLLCLIFQVRKIPHENVVIDTKSKINYSHQHGILSIKLIVIYWILFVFISTGVKIFPAGLLYFIILSIAMLFILIYILFFKNHNSYENNTKLQSRVLNFHDLWKYISLKSAIFIVLALLLALLGHIFREYIFGSVANIIAKLFSDNLSFTYILSFFSTFLTEIFSNTALIYVITSSIFSIPHNPEIQYTLISLSTVICSYFAFMLPTATSVNALVYGGIQNFDFKKMIYCGLIMSLSFLSIVPLILFLFVARIG